MSALRSSLGVAFVAAACTLAAPARADQNTAPAPVAPAPAAPAPAPAAPSPAPAPAAVAPAARVPAPAPGPAPAPAFIPPPSSTSAAAEAQPPAAAPDQDTSEAGVPSKPLPSSLEVFGMLAMSITTGEPANPEATDSFRRVGLYGEVGVAFRSSYFIDPFVSVGYGSLASADTRLPDGPYGAGGTLHQHLGTWFISPGVTANLWRFRPRLGIGIAVVAESNKFNGDQNTATQLPLAYQLGLGFNCYNSGRFRLDADAKFVQAKGADVTFWALGVTARGDLLYFGGGT